jgi:hypothetical protein
MSASTAMNRTTPAASPSKRRGVACTLAAVALLAVAIGGCNNGKRSYPTISARNPDGGNVSVRGTYNHCPEIFFVASPDHTSVGQTITLNALGFDQDNDPLTYVWTTSLGKVDDPHAAMTVFHCTERGSVNIGLTVSDGECDSTSSGQLICQLADTGSPGTGGTAPTGTGGQAGSIGGQGTGGVGGTSSATAGTTGAAGSITAGAAGSTASGSGGTVGSGGVTGSGGMGNGSGAGGTACLETNPPANLATDCQTCLVANENPINDGCCPIATTDPMGFTLCQAASACMRAGGPPVGTCNMTGDVTSCFCGTVPTTTCDAPGQANGPCLAQVKAAAGRDVVMHATDSPTAAQILQRYSDPRYAIGRAANIHAVTVFCPTECGLGQ